MANTYESKFKGVEIDDGVNIATYATGTGGINVTIKGATNFTGTGGRHLEIDGSGKQDKLTVSSNVHINSLTIATSSADGLYFTNETGAGISYRILVGAGSGTAPLARLTVPNDIAGKTQTIATREYVNAHSSSYNPGSGINISGNTISLAERIMVDNITLGNYSSGNVILLPRSGASGNVYFPKYGGYLATTGDIPAVVQATGSSMTSVMSQKTVADELGKKQDKITDQTSLNARALSANSLNIGGSGAVINSALTVTRYSSLNGIFVDNSTTKPICFKRNEGIVTKMYGPTSGGGELVNVYLPGKGGTLALTSDIPAPSKLYRHKIVLNMKNNVYASSGDQAYISLIYLTVYSSDPTPYTDVQDFYNKQGGGSIGFSCPSANVISKTNSQDQAHPFGCCFLGSKTGDSYHLSNFYAYYNPTTHLTYGYILYIASDLENAIKAFQDLVYEV